MTLRQVPGTDVTYHLVCFDKEGRERPEGAGTLASSTLRALAAVQGTDEKISDVFFLSHGWQGDIPAAIDQYDRWLGTMAARAEDRRSARTRHPGFRSLVIGLHWPSKPWGDERVPSPSASGLLSDEAEPAAPMSIDEMVDVNAERLADTPAARAALHTILETARRDEDADSLPEDVRQAYETLRIEAGLTSDGDMLPPAAGGVEAWDAQAVYQQLRQEQDGESQGLLGGNAGGAGVSSNILSPLRQLSFWKMKDRGRIFGETGAADLLRLLQESAPQTTRFHLMGHSFGCIVVSAAVAGTARSRLLRPVDSLVLAQGALSLWAYSANVPDSLGKPGYFHRIVDEGLVRGPIVTTRSLHDTAVGKYYPLGAQLASQYLLGDLPKYGGIGTYGIQGLNTVSDDVPMAPTDFNYAFRPGRIYNLDARNFISHGDGPSGAHNDIAHPEVAHAAWQAVLAVPEQT
ncbi:hypothetical protein LVY72_20810 [Arthrobacter sp. I2-34]|uniref:Alpha/beta hydrolase n=1 Tax=Arthrobacter hankyongi TaxID=2904801 RepID=A0ABS9LCM0_9MICC|nr:hypothetical protein [Arthrobacter hankyongi]MCG2624336.1 hypothetical protein [Arthrobacter hankyongi]